ncbi:MAG: hypothetical protein R8P61_17815 [Bacteroidia bacterium]|nr:hypothetical protein [Bacteroidia bacterium]
MEGRQEFELLIPNYVLDEIVAYRVFKEESFSFKGSSSKPFKRVYSFELRELEGKVYEIYYPQSLLSVSKYFLELEEEILPLAHPQNSSLYLSINEDDELEMLNFEAIKKNLFQLKEALKEQLSTGEQDEQIEELFDYLSTKEKAAKYLMEDLRYLFDFHGLAKEDGVYLDFTKEESKLESVAKSVFSMIGINPLLSSMDVMKFDYLEDGSYKIESLSGIDTLSTDERHDFEKIQECFLKAEFDFDAYQDITLHHKQYLYDIDNILSSYFYTWKTDTPDMRKHKEIRIERLDN